MAEQGSWRVVLLTGVGHAASHSWELVFPAVAIPIARDFGMSFEDAVALAAPLYLLFGLGAPLAGWASDRFGARVVLIACLIGGGLSGLGVAASDGPLVLTFTLAGLGLAASLYHPSGLALLSVWFPDRMGRAFAINGIAGNIGIAATPLVAGLAASLFGWRMAYLVFCVPSLLVGIVFVFFRFDDRPVPKAAPRESKGRPDLRPLVLMAIAVTAGGLAYRLHTLVVPALLAERLPFLASFAADFGLERLEHVDNLGATALTSVAYAMGIAGQWVGGKVADRFRLVSAYLVFHLCALPLLAGAAWLTGWPLLFFLVFYIFFSIGMQPIENSLVAQLSPPAWRGRAYAGKFVLGFGVGALGTYVVGWVAPYGGLGAALSAGVILELVLIGAVVYLSRVHDR